MAWRLLAAKEDDPNLRSFFSIALAGCIALVLGAVGTLLLSERRNEAAAQAEAVAVRDALAVEVRQAADRLRDISATSPQAGRAPAAHGPFIQLFVADPAAPPAAGEPWRAPAEAALRGQPAADGLRGAIEPGETLSDGDVRAAVVREGLMAALVVARGGATRRDGARGPSLIGVTPIDGAMLARLAREARVRPLDLRLSRDAAPDNENAVLLTAPGEPAVALAWRPETPGDDLFRALGSLLVCFAALFATFIVVRSRRVTRELVDSEARAKADATHDLLTGLPNRALFSRSLQVEVDRLSRGQERCFGVLYLDIDRFKEINDTFGHQAGDQVIVTVAQRVLALLQSSGRVARLGGDEFAILQTDIEGPRDCALLARRILDAFTQPIELGMAKVYVGVSIGVALCPHDARTQDELTHSADLALYRAKNEGRNRFCFFEQRMGEELRMRKTVEDDLRNAIDTDQLAMEFQPVMAIDGETMVGVEALVRWQHPVQGKIAPGSFITLAEECGLILPLGRWVLRQALRAASRWPGLRVAVNVSAIQFRQKDFVSTVQALLDETGVDAGQLELELTETVLLADADQAEDAMIELRAMGVRLALDDFGTGYSSLIYLRRFAFDKIKIDKSFLESTESTGESAIIVHSIVHLGRALGLTVTAEGVETADQHRFLQALGCHEMQGYLFSAPVPAADIDRRLGVSPMRAVA